MHLFTNFICPGSVIGVGQKNGRSMAKKTIGFIGWMLRAAGT